MAVIKAVSSKAGIGQAIDYVTKEEKTEEKLVSGLHCEAGTAKEEMQATKELWEKTGGRMYKHFVQSYHKDEKITPEQAHRNALQLAENMPAWKGFEVLVATHKDKDHIHTHFIVNSVNFEDGHKLQWSSADLRELKEQVEQLENSNELLQNAISAEIGSLRDEVRESTVQEVRKALQANIEAVQRATKALEKQSDTLTSVMKQKVRELEESKNSFFRYEGLKLYLFWGGMICNALVFLMLVYSIFVK